MCLVRCDTCCFCIWLDLGCVILAVIEVVVRCFLIFNFQLDDEKVLDHLPKPLAEYLSTTLFISTIVIATTLIYGAIIGTPQCVRLFILLDAAFFPIFVTWLYFVGPQIVKKNNDSVIFRKAVKLIYELLKVDLSRSLFILFAIAVSVFQYIILWKAHSLYEALSLLYVPRSYGEEV